MGGRRRKKSIETDVGKCEVEEGASECAGGAWVGVRSEGGIEKVGKEQVLECGSEKHFVFKHPD